MRWEDRGTSRDIEDRRGMGGGRGPGIRIGLGGLLLLGVLSLVFQRNFFALLGDGAVDVGESETGATRGPAGSPEEEEVVRFVSFVLDDVQDVWTREFQELGRTYDRSKLVLFTDATRSGCGFAESAMGPFYCPADQKVYIDLGFYAELRRRYGAPGDFAQAYVIAHEVGHHVQAVLGLARIGERGDNETSVRRELQADCFPGIWAHHANRTRQVLEEGDLEEALNAAAAVGDDRLQKRAQGQVAPESFTHGTSAQRERWFRRGFETGEVAQCDTFRARSL
jgi:predicted metalloprotease